MGKPTIAKLFFGSLIAIIGGIVLLGAGAIWAFASGVLVMNGPDVVGVEPSALGWSVVGALVVGVIAILGGAIGQFVAWIGAVLNTSHLEDKTWFVLLLVLGLVSFGFVAMLVYVLAGPDGIEVERRRLASPLAGAA
jgi:hypothetical protein